MTIKYIAEHLPYTLSHILSRHIQWKGHACLPLFQTNKQVSFVSCLNVPRLLHLLTPPSLLSCFPNLWYRNVLATRLRKIPPFITTCQAQQGHSPSHSPAASLIWPQRRHETSKIFCHRQKLVLICFKIRVSIKLNCASVERTLWALKECIHLVLTSDSNWMQSSPGPAAQILQVPQKFNREILLSKLLYWVLLS